MADERSPLWGYAAGGALAGGAFAGLYSQRQSLNNTILGGWQDSPTSASTVARSVGGFNVIDADAPRPSSGGPRRTGRSRTP